MPEVPIVSELPPDYGGRGLTRHNDIARQLRRQPRRWGLVTDTAASRRAAYNTASRIRIGGYPAYLPAHAFEARAITTEDGVHQVWARYVGGDAA
ncbi:hypothetical protein FZ103_00140 [Streptomonospora sp. PA3]|uniref:hypothetical protein n=1 Tax=Streptomonospora sp. PA3 TaxID=2607326 RepID=UPI0012DEAEA0|nr:hypothetical protein [Streptomonospora sp. PA3]MUL39603.1 hypothetical protein [Streptomonospora sp. PA3]